MPLRSWAGVQTVTAIAQPVFGTVVAANGSLSPDQFTGSTKPGNNPSLSYIPVNSVIGWNKDDRVLVGPRQGPYDGGGIYEIVPGVLPAGTLVVSGLQKQHLAGELVILNIDVANVKIVPFDGNAGVLYIGNAYTLNNAGTDPSTLDMLAPPQAAGQPTYVFESGSLGPAGIKTSEIWITGQPADKFLARMGQL